jgi:DNA-binding NarL/FixJ family response regulator
MCRDNSIVPLPELMKKELQHKFESRYKFPSGISWEIVLQDWCRELDTNPPTPPTVRAILFSDKDNCEYRIADGLCQLLCKLPYDDWIKQLKDDLEDSISLGDSTTLELEITDNRKKTAVSAASDGDVGKITPSKTVNLRDSLQSHPKRHTPSILVVDDHHIILEGMLDILHRQYPNGDILTAKTTKEADLYLSSRKPDLLILDLSLPDRPQATPTVETGLEWLKKVLESYPRLNIMVQSSYINVLMRLKHQIDLHQGGFTIADKGLSETDMLHRLDWAIQGISHTKDLKADLEMKPEWLEVLTLAFDQGLQDKAIAKHLNVSDRMVRHYWRKIQDVLGIYPEDEKNLRILTFKRAREEGLID